MTPEERNPQGFKVGDLVRVTGVGHAQFGRIGKIHEFFGVLIESGKPRASIEVVREANGDPPNPAGFIFVSLVNLTLYSQCPENSAS
jgi:hypothetical protein